MWSCQPLTSLSSFSLIRFPSSFLLFFFFNIASLSLSVPSILLPTRLHLFFLTSLSFLPVFQPWFFPPSFTVTLSLFRLISFTFHDLLSFILCASGCFSVHPNHINTILPFPLLDSLFRICDFSQFLAPFSPSLFLSSVHSYTWEDWAGVTQLITQQALNTCTEQVKINTGIQHI